MSESHKDSESRFQYLEIGETSEPPQRVAAPAEDSRPQPAEPTEEQAPEQPEPAVGGAITVPRFRPFTQEQARTMLRAWAASKTAGGLLGRRRWAQQGPIAKVINLVGYRARLLTQYENRSVRYEESRLTGEPIVSTRSVGDLWSYRLPRPTDFVNRTEAHPIQGTDQLVDCGECHGLGLVRCPRCHGRGVTTAGSLEEGMALMTCPACRGAASVRCGRCRGQGQMRRFAVLAVRYSFRDSSMVVADAAVPEEVVRRVRGESFLTLREQKQVHLVPINEPLDEAIRMLQQRSHAAAGERILFQQVEAEAFPVARVEVEARGGRRLGFWTFGAERKPWFPHAWRSAGISWVRVAAFVLGALALGFGAIYVWLQVAR